LHERVSARWGSPGVEFIREPLSVLVSV